MYFSAESASLEKQALLRPFSGFWGRWERLLVRMFQARTNSWYGF